jgi:thiol:disulfide interchange protein DsbC
VLISSIIIGKKQQMALRTWRTCVVVLAALGAMAALSAAAWAYLNRPGHGGFILEVEQHVNRVFRLDTRTADLRTLPLGDAIRTVRGNGSRTVVVFADPYCPYCAKLEKTLDTAQDVTVYTFLYPIVTPDSKAMSARLWCAGDRSAAWSRWMLDGVEPNASPACDTSTLDRNIALGRKLRVLGTPTVIFANGKRMNHAPSAPELAQALAGSGTSSRSASGT